MTGTAEESLAVRQEKAEAQDAAFEQLKEEILACRLCARQFGFEPHPVFRGNRRSKIMQVSQAPSKTVHQTLKSFDDASGRRLRGDWYRIPDALFYDPDCFYITSVAHCYPGKSPHKGDNPPPKHCAQKWLAREMALVDYQLMILVGGKAAAYFFPGRAFTELVFRDQVIEGRPAFVIPHPSPLNVKWFKDHPEFERDRIRTVRRAVHGLLGLEEGSEKSAGKSLEKNTERSLGITLGESQKEP